MLTFDSAITQNTVGDSEGRPEGVPTSYDWYNGAKQDTPAPPSNFTAVTGWGQVYQQAGQPATNPNAQVQLANAETYVHLKSTGAWVLVQNQDTNQIEGDHFVADFSGNQSISMPITTNADGSASFSAPPSGHNDHFWPSARGTYAAGGDVDAVYVQMDMRVMDPNAHLVANIGADWWRDASAPFVDGFGNNPGAGMSNWVDLTTEWRTLAFYSSSSVFHADPPPVLQSTGTAPPPADNSGSGGTVGDPGAGDPPPTAGDGGSSANAGGSDSNTGSTGNGSGTPPADGGTGAPGGSGTNTGTTGNDPATPVGDTHHHHHVHGDWHANDLSGTETDDVLSGHGGNDRMAGGSGNDHLSGGRGSDILFGGDGNDDIHGGAGRDIIRGDAGSDVIDGGSGKDIVLLSGSFDDYTIDVGRHSVRLTNSAGETDVVKNVEQFHFLGNGDGDGATYVVTRHGLVETNHTHGVDNALAKASAWDQAQQADAAQPSDAGLAEMTELDLASNANPAASTSTQPASTAVDSVDVSAHVDHHAGMITHDHHHDHDHFFR